MHNFLNERLNSNAVKDGASTTASVSTNATIPVAGNRDADVDRAIETPASTTPAGTNLTGKYMLWGIITHKGASSEGGHYIGWVRKDDDADIRLPNAKWLKFDDDKVSIVDQDKIATLEGGGEDSSAYILLYRALRI